MKRSLLVAAFVLAALPLSAVNAAASGSGRVVYHSSQQFLIGKDRGHAHKAALYWSACLGRYAKQQAQAMAARDTMYHSNISRMFGCRTGARQVGENVGVIKTGGVAVNHDFLDRTINSAFMASPHHRANILGPYHYVGSAWAQSANGDWFVAVEFG
jgi:uncharacterized protein YkwD